MGYKIMNAKKLFFVLNIFVAIILFTPNANARAMTGDVEWSSDNEGLTTQRYLIGYRDWFFEDWELGIKVGQFFVKDYNGKTEMDEIRLTMYHEFAPNLFTWGYVGKLVNHDWSEPTGNLGIGYVVNDKLYLEYSLSKNTFDTFITINNQVGYVDNTLFAEYKFTSHLLGEGYFSLGESSTDNNYTSRRGVIKYFFNDTFDEWDVRIDYRNRGYDYRDVGYFSPADWTLTLFGGGYEKRLNDTWDIEGSVLVGPQAVDGASGTFSELKLKLDYNVTDDIDFGVDLAHITSTVNDYDYRWNWVGLHLIWAF